MIDSTKQRDRLRTLSEHLRHITTDVGAKLRRIGSRSVRAKLIGLACAAMAALVVPQAANAQQYNSLSQLNVFGGADVPAPVMAGDGNLYVVWFDPDHLVDFVYQITPNGNQNPLNIISGPVASPASRLIQGSDGNLYGVLSGGQGFGTVYQLTLSGNFTDIYDFNNGADGGTPVASLLQASDGNLYGTTSTGGIGQGTVFEIVKGASGVFGHVGSSDTTFRVITNLASGSTPLHGTAPLIEGSDHLIYGVDPDGGASHCGSIFRFGFGGINSSLIHSFVASADGAFPVSITQAADGNFYGECAGGTGNIPGFWQYKPGLGTSTRFHAYGTYMPGSVGSAPLVDRGDGNLYGVVVDNSKNGSSILKISQATLQSSLIYDLPGYTGTDNIGLGTDGNIYGALTSGLVFDFAFPTDTSAPTTTAVLNGTSGTNGWYTSSVAVTLSATDPDDVPAGSGSDVASTAYSIDGGPNQPYSATFQVSGEGTHTVKYFSTDKAGNVETANSKTIKIDTVAPTTGSSNSGVMGLNGWYLGGVLVTLSPSDATSGVAATYYSLDGGAYTLSPGFVHIVTTGSHSLNFYSVDTAGNVEATHSITVNEDGNPPVTTAVLSGPGSGTTFTGPVTVTLNATDVGSGVVTTSYSVDGGPTQTYSGPFTVSANASHTIAFYSIDLAGNSEALNLVTFDIVGDTTPPTITASPSTNTLWPPNGKTVNVSVTGTFTDSGSGIDPNSLSYSVADSYGQVQPSGSISVNADGSYSFSVGLVASRNGNDKAGRTYTITITGMDMAGNVGTATVTVTVPHNQ